MSLPRPNNTVTTNDAETVLVTNERKLTHKAYQAKIEDVNKDERAVVAVVSTGTVDRDHEILLPQGARLAEFRKNPVVLWAHRYDQPPVAKVHSPGWIRYDKGSGAIRAKMIFADTAFADEIFRLYQGDFLRAFSVGFDSFVSEWVKPGVKEISNHPEWEGAVRVYTKWEILEFSAVPVPINTEALATAVSKGILKQAAGYFEGVEISLPDDPGSTDNETMEPQKAPARRVLLSETRTETVVTRRRRVIIPRTPDLHSPPDVLSLVREEFDRRCGRM